VRNPGEPDALLIDLKVSSDTPARISKSSDALGPQDIYGVVMAIYKR